MESHEIIDPGGESSLEFQRKRAKDKLGLKTPTQLADDIINEVMNHLPVVSNFRFKCVSKQWLFLNIDALKRKSKRHSMYGIFYTTTDFIRHKTMVEYAEMQKDQNEGSSIDRTLSFLPKISDTRIYDSCGGLLLCGGLGNDCLYICNPATRKWVKIQYHYEFISKAILDFKPLVSDHFNIMVIKFWDSQYSFEVFASETGKWKVLNQMEFDPSSVLLFKGLFFGISWRHACISGFDMEGNLCRRFDLPDLPGSSFMKPLSYTPGLGQSGGYLHYCYRSEGVAYVWKLVDYESGSWLLKSCLLMKVSNFVCMKFHPDEDVVFLRLGERWHSYNMRTTQMVEICSAGWHDNLFPYSPFYLDFGVGGKLIRE